MANKGLANYSNKKNQNLKQPKSKSTFSNSTSNNCTSSTNSVEPLPESSRPRRDGPGGN